MDRCPNCDATVRPNAKFCTSCGFRLPTAEAVKPVSPPTPASPASPAAQADGWRSPFATTSNYEHNQSWTAPVPSPSAPPPPAPFVMPVTPVEPIAPAPTEAIAVVEEPAPVFAGWPDFSTSTIPAEEPLEAAVDTRAETVSDIEAPVVVEEFVPEPVVDEPVVVEATAEEVTPVAVDDEIIEPIAPETSDVPVAINPAVEETTGVFRSLPEAGENPVDNPTEPIPVMSAIAKSDIVERALGLVDELRNLIPNLKSGSNSAHAGDAVAILQAAHAGSADSDALTELRGALETAATRPRDIDVMMDLVSRAGAIQDLLAERDKFNTAISAALSALGGSAE